MRERRKVTPESLAGSLLLAHPALKDPNFHRTVILMSTHGADGAMGVVLNRPLGRRLGELNGDFALGALAGVPLFKGGPVEAEQLILAVWQPSEEGFRLHFGVEPARAIQMLELEGVQVRAFLGYSGWSRGQLENELQHNTWVVSDVPPDLLTRPSGIELWRTVLGSLGEQWRLLAGEPEDLESN